jgi:hypothetical protein
MNQLRAVTKGILARVTAVTGMPIQFKCEDKRMKRRICRRCLL